MTFSDVLSILSIVVGLFSIVLSVWFFVKSSELSNKTNETLVKIDNATNTLKEMHDNYVKMIFDMFKNTHEKMADKQFNGPTKEGGNANSKKV